MAIPPLSDATITFYTRPRCHLCDVAKPILHDVANQLGMSVEERNVERNADWERAYGTQVPVAFLGQQKLFKFRVERAALLARLRGYREA